MDPFVAEIRIFPFNFAPRGWAFCDGQILPISQNTALFSLLGTTYGGNGTSNFALPNLQGRAPMHPGQGPGLSLHDLGEQGGSDTVTLVQNEIPGHTHGTGATLQASVDLADGQNPSGGNLAGSVGFKAYSDAGADSTLGAATFSAGGSDQGHNNMQPYLTLNYCIALQGVFPPRT